MAPTELVVDSEEDLQLLLSMKRQLTEEEEEDEMPLSARKKARTASQSGASNQNLLPDEVPKIAIQNRPLDLALFDISISDIDCRYINTFKKYQY